MQNGLVSCSKSLSDIPALEILNDTRSSADPSAQVLASSIFDGFWIPVTVRNKLPKSCTARYVTDKTWLQFEAPTEDDVEKVTEEGAEDELEYEADDDVGDEIHNETRDDATAGKVTNHQPRPPSPDFDQSSSSSESETDHLTDAEFLKYAALQPKYKPPHLAWKCDRCNGKSFTFSCVCIANDSLQNLDTPLVFAL